MINLSLALRCCLAIALCGLAMPRAQAEDIDLFAGIPSASDRPNVLILLDSSANWSSSIPVADCRYRENGIVSNDGPKATSPDREQGTKMGIEKCALYNVIDGLPTGPGGEALVNVGLMLFNESPASTSGGYPRKALTPLTAEAKSAFKLAIRGLKIGADKGNNAAFSKSLYEAFLYLSQRAPYRGKAGVKWDPAAFRDGRYVLPAASGCGKNFVIFITNGKPGEVTDGDALALLKAEKASVAQIRYPSSYVSNSDQGNWADEFARFMNGADVGSRDGVQSIITHTIAVTGAPSDGNYPNFVEGIAVQGGGRFRKASNVDALVDAVTTIFNQILAVNSVFSAASLPISVNSRGTYRNQIFIGMFRPDAGSLPRWNGNLKQYRFDYDQATDSLQIVDQEGEPAINSATGFIDPGATSYWTRPSTFWANAPSGVPKSGSDAPDGAVVEKGGAAQRWRTAFAADQASRRILTCAGCANGTTLGATLDTQFTVTNARVTAAALNTASALERATLIDWVRGTDNRGDEAGPGLPTTVRPSIHGDVIHSRPAALSYGARVVVFYGANDGMLHAVEGAREGESGGLPLWSFVPEESYGRLNRLRQNDPLVRFPSTPSSVVTARPRDWFVDGPIGVYQKYDAAGALQKAYLFVAMRRGGRVLYAFDVTNPDAPRLLWKRSSADLPVLGQTWSEPKVARIRGNANPVLIMGAGYDPAEDQDPAGATTMGNAVLVLDAPTGMVLRQFGGLARPVPADVALVDADFDGFVDRGYVGDLGGNLYRIDLEVGTATAPADWQIRTLASLGSSGGRKLFYAPDVVLTRTYAMVLVGSGDREKPLKTSSSDYFYAVLDRELGKGVSADFRTTSFAELTGVDGFSSAAAPRGCYLALDTNGEKVVNGATTVGGLTYFSTHKPTLPDANSCTSNLGLARNYAMPLFCRSPAVTEVVGGGLAPTPVVGVVEMDVVDPSTGAPAKKLVPFIIGGKNAKNSAIEGSKVRMPITPRRSRLYWHSENEGR